MDRVEGGDEVVDPRLRRRVEVAEVARGEGRVRVALGLRLVVGVGGRLLREVEPVEAAVGEPAGHQVDRLAPAAAGVEHPDARLEPLGQAGHQWQAMVLERRQHGLAAVLGHQLVEAVEA